MMYGLHLLLVAAETRIDSSRSCIFELGLGSYNSPPPSCEARNFILAGFARIECITSCYICRLNLPIDLPGDLPPSVVLMHSERAPC